MQVREKVGKSRNIVFFQWFVAPQVGSLKRRVRSHLARWEMKNCTPLWREAHFQVKMYKTPHARTTFGSWAVEKVHAVVARSTFRNQNAQNTPVADHFLEVEMSKKCTRLWPEAHFEVKMHKAHQVRTTFGRWDVEKVHAVVVRSTFQSQNAQNAPAPDHFWKLRCRKSARCCGAKHISKSKCTKHTSGGPLLEVEMSKKCTRLWREAHFEVKMYKTPHARATFGDSDVVSRGRGKGLRTLSKGAEREGFVAFPKTMAGVGHLNRICKDAFSVAGAVQETCSSELLGVRALISWEGLHFAAWDLQVCWDDFAWHVQHFVWPGLTFSWQAQYFRQVEWKNRKTHWCEAVSAARNFPLSTLKKWRSLSELRRFF